MHYSQINVRYAKSLFLLAKEKNIVDEIRQDIDLVYNVFQEVEDFKILLEHPVIKSSTKSDIISKIFKGKVNKYTLSFLQLIIKNKRENHLKGICRDFIEICRKYKGIRTAVLTTAYQLSEDEKKIIKQIIEKKFEATIELKDKVNEELIGGMVIQVDDKELDLSIAKQIQVVRNSFLNIDFNNKTKK